MSTVAVVLVYNKKMRFKLQPVDYVRSIISERIAEDGVTLALARRSGGKAFTGTMVAGKESSESDSDDISMVAIGLL